MGLQKVIGRKPKAFGYAREELAAILDAVNVGLSCGNPVAFPSLKRGEVVVDLGGGGGLDSFLAAPRVGPEDKAIDLIPEIAQDVMACIGRMAGAMMMLLPPACAITVGNVFKLRHAVPSRCQAGWFEDRLRGPPITDYKALGSVMSKLCRKLVIAVLATQLTFGCCLACSLACDSLPCHTNSDVLLHDLPDLHDCGTCLCDCPQRNHDPCHRSKCCGAEPRRLASSRHLVPMAVVRSLPATSAMWLVFGGSRANLPPSQPFFTSVRLHLAKQVLLI